MTKVALVGTIEVAQGRKDELVALLMAHRARCLEDEPGTIQIEVLVPREDNPRILVYEVYRDDAAFETHLRGPSIAQWRAETSGMVVSFQVTKCALVEPQLK
jgi:autoinducer 2-degrading protein